jgi:hypothetical protein
MIVWDETTYFPQYNILHLGDGNDSKPCYVGGADGKAVIDARGTRPEQLQKLDLAQVCLSFIVKRASAERCQKLMAYWSGGCTITIYECVLGMVIHHVITHNAIIINGISIYDYLRLLRINPV